MEKRGLTEQLAQAGVSDATGLYFGDEMRVGLIGQVRRVWAPRGVKIEQQVEYQYEWAYLNLAVNGLAGRLTWDWTDNMKAASIAPVVKSWAEHGVQVMVWDRAPGHRGEVYRDVSVQRIEQLPYSPQLNPSERIFEYLRDRIEGQIYGTMAAQKKAVEKELRQLAEAPQKIKQLAGWEWIPESVNQLSAQNMAVS